MTYIPKSWTKADLLATINRLQVELHHANACRQSAWDEAGKARAETAEVMEQRPGLEDLRDLAKDLKLATDGDAVDVIDRIRAKTKDCDRCDYCGEEAKHHLCDACDGYREGARSALDEVIEELETPARDDAERRLQREAIERIAEEYTGRSPQLRRAS